LSGFLRKRRHAETRRHRDIARFVAWITRVADGSSAQRTMEA
jgi:hypothetical protein